MIRSMTGFGRADVVGAACALIVEARSVNHRHLDIGLRLPSALAFAELDARKLIQGRLERGRVDVSVQLTSLEGRPAQVVRVDAALARRHLAEARALARDLELRDDLGLAWVLDQPGVMRVEEAPGPEPEALGPLLEQALGRALDDLVARRETEGTALAAELRDLLAELGAVIETMTGRAPAAVARRTERLRERMTTLLGEVPLDESRLLAEIAVWASKLDVSEELARLRVHLGEFERMLDKGGAVGRGFDFLIQEIQREVNTTGSKADDLELSQAAVAAKGVLEKMREQVQNLE